MTQAVPQGVSKAIGEGDVSKQMLKNSTVRIGLNA